MATDFFDRQDVARRKTTRLVVLFALAVVAIIVSVDLLLSALTAYLDFDNPSSLLETALTLTVDPRILAVAVGGTLLLVVAGSAYKAAQLWGGGRVVAEHLGGRRLNPDTTVPTERQLLNVVEEMVIASGTSVPPVYLLEGEEGSNAFAAGYSLNDAVIGITQGTAERLSRDELQGVVAHEFSHVLNGDMRLNLRLIGLLHGIMLLALVGQFVFRIVAHSGVTRRGSREETPVPVLAFGALVLGAGLMAIGFVGTFFGSIIKAAVSRQREYLADASAVQFTRNPGGIAGALKKIGGLTRRAHVDNPNAPEMSHLFFGQATSGLTSMFATHPPLAERIRRLDPGWDGKFVESYLSPAAPPRPRPAPPVRAPAPVVAPLVVGGTASALTQAVTDIGQPREVHLAYAGHLVGRIPEGVARAAHDSYGARAVVYALLLDRQPRCREQQLAHLAGHADAGVVEETHRLVMPVARLDASARLPLLEMAMPALDALTDAQYAAFKANVAVLIAADDRLALFEWALQRILIRQLDAQHGRVSPPRVRYATLPRVAEECRMVLSMLAWVGHPLETVAGHAFGLGWQALGLPPEHVLPLEECDFVRLDGALTVLDSAAPAVKRTLLQGSVVCIEADASVTVNEVEFLRAVAASLGCPMPPLVLGS